VYDIDPMMRMVIKETAAIAAIAAGSYWLLGFEIAVLVVLVAMFFLLSLIIRLMAA
jgi:hypothetical protein